MGNGNALVPLNQLCEFAPGGVRLHRLWRWTTIGVRGVKLEHRRIGGRIFSSRDSLDRFFRTLDELGAANAAAPLPAA